MLQTIQSLFELLFHPLNKGNIFLAFLRILWWKINQVFFKYPAVVEIVPRTYCMCYPDSSFGSLIVYVRLPEYKEMALLLMCLRDNDVFIDVGCNIGAFSLLALSQIKSGRVIAFEPTEEVLKRFQENIRLNAPACDVEAHQFVVSDKNGFVDFSFGDISEVNHISVKKRKNTQKVKSVRLDTFLAEKSIKEVGCMKIDVEGAEYKVLQGMKKHLQNHSIDMGIIEINPKSEDFSLHPREVMQFLSKFSYTLYSIKNTAASFALEKVEVKELEGLKRAKNFVFVAPTKKAQARIAQFK